MRLYTILSMMECSLLLATSGCTVTRSEVPGKRYDVQWHLIDSVFDSLFRQSEYDELWQQGYGFNNPNAKRPGQ